LWGPKKDKRKKKFFFEKKNQKTFGFMVHVVGALRDSIKKVFCFFFSKKKRLPFFGQHFCSIP
jgi:hypothetical protein